MTGFFIDVAPLQETEFTGIPQVTAKLCEQLLGDASVEPGFFYNRMEVPARIVEQLLAGRDGRLFRWAAERYAIAPLVAPRGDGAAMGLHTNMKFARRLFPTEGQIVHDLTTLVTPHYHTAVTNAYHQEKFYGDLMSHDVTFCVSNSTATDVRAFFPDLPSPVVVSHLGVDWDHIDEASQRLLVEPEDYILVLGTLEPRKNIADILRLLAQEPGLARRYRFVFGGRTGWGDAFEEQVARHGLAELYRDGRIMRTGFVSETAKYLLFKHAAAVIYPSIYEGFGLPVAEAISLGVPVVTTPSSSLPEVGGDLAYYFIPGDLPMFAQALFDALARSRLDPDRVRDWRRHFSWSSCYATIRDALMRASDARAAARAPREAADVRA